MNEDIKIISENKFDGTKHYTVSDKWIRESVYQKEVESRKKWEYIAADWKVDAMKWREICEKQNEEIEKLNGIKDK